MTQPTLPDAAAQQRAAVEVFAQYEPQLYEAYLDMMLEWLAAVKTAMFAGGVARLTLVPDPMTVFSQSPKWDALTDQYTEQVAREVLAAPYKDLFADGTLFESRPFVRNWIAARANRLQRVPDEVFGLVAHIIDSAATNGASIPDVQAQVEHLFSDTNVQQWKNRARTVARTEVVGAYNGGLHDAFTMLADADPDTSYVHRWLATEDQRTRPDHREADGQTVPWGQPFTVGGYQMMHPHDPTAPAKEIINCRCVELLEVAGEPTDMSSRQYKGPPSLKADGGFTRPYGFTGSQGLSLMQAVCTHGQFCQQTHKPGLCKGQHRGETEPGTQDATKASPVQQAQTAVKGLTDAIGRAQAIAAAEAARNPKLAAMARRAIADYQKALKPQQQTLKQAAGANAKAQGQAARDAAEQDRLDAQAKRAAARKAAKEKRHADSLKRRADAIIARRREAAKVAKMTPKQRAAYGKAKAAQAKAKHRAAEDKVLNEAGRG